jgi:hypothetical protein
MKDHRLDAVRREPVANHHDRLGRVAEHRQGDPRLPVILGQFMAVGDHAGHRGGDVVEHRAADRVQSEDVGHRMHHHHVLGADQWPERAVTRGDRRDDDLGDADRERHHGAGGQDGAFGSPQADHAVQPPLGIEIERQLPQPGQHAVDRLAPAAGVAERVNGGAGEHRDFGARDVRHDVKRVAENAGIGHHGLHAEGVQTVAEVADFRAFGVERTDEQDGWHARLTCACAVS